MFRIAFRLFLCSLLVVLLGGGLFSCSKSEDITIGAILVLTSQGGKTEPTADEVLNGLELAVESVNADGGVMGRQIKLVYKDCSSDVDMAKESFRELAVESPAVIITMYSHVSKALVPLASKLQIPQLAILSTDETLLDDSTHSFRYWPKASTEAKASLKTIGKINVRTLGVINVDMAYGNSVAKELIALADQQGVISRNIRYKTIDRQLHDDVAALKGADAIHFTCYPSDLIPLAQLIRSALPDVQILGPNTISSPNYSTAPELEGIYLNAPLIYNPSFPYAVDVSKEYIEKTGLRLSLYSAIGYDSITLLAQLMRRGGALAEDVRAELETGFTYPGIFGEVIKPAGGKDFSFPLYPARVMNGMIAYQER